MKTLIIALLLLGQAGTGTQRYDPKRNAEQDIRNAIVDAQKTGKRILLEVGGEWCSWCHVLDRYFRDQSGLRALRDRSYITLKVNVSPQNENKAALSKYPDVPGYPHFFVLDTDGKLLHSQKTYALEDGDSYNLVRFTEFLQKWAPPGR